MNSIKNSYEKGQNGDIPLAELAKGFWHTVKQDWTGLDSTRLDSIGKTWTGDW